MLPLGNCHPLQFAEFSSRSTVTINKSLETWRNMHSSEKKNSHPRIGLGRLIYPATFLSVFLLAALTSGNGKSVKIITSWFNPNYEGQAFHKVLVIGVAQDLEVRADFEDEL